MNGVADAPDSHAPSLDKKTLPTLLFENGPDRGSGLELNPEHTYLLGRDPRCDVVVRDDLVSRHHAKIKEFKGTWYIRDQGSTNGVMVNDQRVQQGELHFGDQIQLGQSTLTFMEEDLEAVSKETTLGGYRLRQRLGRGGMGTVFKALQVSLGREVALKVLSPHLVQDPTFVRRFQKEARAAGQLNHPHIVQVYDVGQEGDSYFFSMEYVSGGSLEDRLREEGKLSPEDALAMLHQAAMALEYAESQHIVHRDIKPDNLMLTDDGLVKIADLGLALSIKESEKSDGPILGTPHFISPEQAMRRDVDIRTDIYSLGATAYRMLSGHTLFEGRSAEEIVKKAVREDPIPLREREPAVPEKLAALVHRMLEKDPDDRFATATALREEIEALSASRKKTVLLVGTMSVAVAALGFAAFLFFKPPQTEIIIQKTEDDGSLKAMRARMSDFERTADDLHAVRKYLAIVESDDSREAERAALAEWLLAFGEYELPEGARAAQTIAAIEAQIREESERSDALLASRTARLEEAAQHCKQALEASDWAGAMISAARLLEDEGSVDEDSRAAFEAEYQRLYKQALERSERHFQEKSAAVAELEKAEEWARAILACQRAAKEFAAPPDGLPDAAHDSLLAYHDWFPAEQERFLKRIETLRGTQQRDDLLVVISAFDQRLRHALLSMNFAQAADQLEQAAETLNIHGYRALLEPTIPRLQAGETAMKQMFQSLDDGSFPNDPPFRVEGSDRATIQKYEADSRSFRMRVPRAVGSTSSLVPLAAFAHPRGVNELLLSRLDLDPDLQIQLLGLMIVVQAASWAEQLAPLADRVRQYDPAVGWTAEDAFTLPSSAEYSLAAAMQSAARQMTNSPHPGEVETLLREARRESDCHEELLAALSPFLSNPPVSLGWAEAAERLNRLMTTHRDTLLIRMVYSTLHAGHEYPLADG